MKSLLKYLGIGILIALAIGVAYVWMSAKPVPKGQPGPEAQRLAQTFKDAAKMVQWPNTGAITWNFAGRRTHLWDRTRGYAQVKWEGRDVLLRLGDQTGVARTADLEPLANAEAEKALQTAYEAHINDAFWLNPFASFDSEGVQFETAEIDGQSDKGLLVTYPTGGVTPGDKYLWIPGPDGLPTAFRMWVQILPVGGLEFSWEDYEPVETGVLISRRHAGPKSFEMTDVRAAPTLSALVDGADPFEPLTSGGPASAPSHPAGAEPASLPASAPADSQPADDPPAE